MPADPGCVSHHQPPAPHPTHVTSPESLGQSGHCIHTLASPAVLFTSTNYSPHTFMEYLLSARHCAHCWGSKVSQQTSPCPPGTTSLQEEAGNTEKNPVIITNSDVSPRSLAEFPGIIPGIPISRHLESFFCPQPFPRAFLAHPISQADPSTTFPSAHLGHHQGAAVLRLRPIPRPTQIGPVSTRI